MRAGNCGILRYRVSNKCLHDIVVYCATGWEISEDTILWYTALQGEKQVRARYCGILRYRVSNKWGHYIVVYCVVGWATSECTILAQWANIRVCLTWLFAFFVTTETRVRSQAGLYGKTELRGGKVLFLSTSALLCLCDRADSPCICIHPSPLRHNLRNLHLCLMTHTN